MRPTRGAAIPVLVTMAAASAQAIEHHRIEGLYDLRLDPLTLHADYGGQLATGVPRVLVIVRTLGSHCGDTYLAAKCFSGWSSSSRRTWRRTSSSGTSTSAPQPTRSVWPAAATSRSRLRCDLAPPPGLGSPARDPSEDPREGQGGKWPRVSQTGLPWLVAPGLPEPARSRTPRQVARLPSTCSVEIRK